MFKDKFTATWVSHSSISDYIKCPRSYFLKNVYRDPKTFHKIQLMQPALALGQAVHDAIDMISNLTIDERFKEPLSKKYEKAWAKISGKKGGFKDREEEKKFYGRGIMMISRLQSHPGPLLSKAVKIRGDLPHFWLSEENNIILCGKIDWLEYFPKSDSVHIIDFKTGKFDEDKDSLQLPIYYLLTKNCQTRKITKMSYWYLDRDNDPISMDLPDEKKSLAVVLEIAQKIALARKLEHFNCRNKNGCRSCLPLEEIIAGRAVYVGINGYNQDAYILK
jgi:ATP-dependent helicase/DNAse subunit B